MRMVMEKLWNIIGKKVWNFVIIHGILPILPLNFTKSVPFIAIIKKFSISLESLYFRPFSFLCKKIESFRYMQVNLRG